ncbi:MAG: hypothetical protein R3E68_07860 [Burkholderiaceae bacterium]
MSATERTEKTEPAIEHPPAGHAPGTVPPSRPIRVVLAGLRIPFWSLVWFFVKAAIAAVPAVLILALIAGALVAAVIQVLGWFGGLSLVKLLGLW